MAEPSPFIMLETPIEDDYDIDWTKRLGSGISGPVRECKSKTSGKSYALKCLTDTPKGLSEAKCHSICTGHPNVVSVVGIYHNKIILPGEMRPNPRILLVLELMEGGELFEQIRKKRRFTEKEAMKFTKEIAQALYHCHSFNVAHRDLKPENLLLVDKSENLVVKLADFGFAKVDQGDLVTPQFTPYYVSPQVLEAQRIHRAQKSGRFPYLAKPYTYDKSCDMWSLGVVIYIMLCGYPPFYSEVPRKQLSQGMRRRIMAGEYSFPEQEWSKISLEAKDVISKLLCVEPGQRLSINELLEHSWLNQNASSPDVELQTPAVITADEEAFEEAMTAHNVQLTEMRISDHVISLKPLSESRNPMLERRKHMTPSRLPSSAEQVPSAFDPDEHVHDKLATKSLRDLIAFCIMPPRRSAEDYCAEDELSKLVSRALELNPLSRKLREALIIESWDGEKFDGSVDKRRLAKAISEIVHNMRATLERRR
ncbi:MAP kinase-activated protein kinase 5-like isoform X2 [Nematostella vectensis]|uniref:MAP kinase-activated protein kinase 5-like isoform X2 n=1 Tax=Nematostella vectensis TaxID=45351 RepID=UPI002076DDD0|nr:MAP kinase-activated protein kinase 5-like isoform X2 [Nematostella vectensis]